MVLHARQESVCGSLIQNMKSGGVLTSSSLDGSPTHLMVEVLMQVVVWVLVKKCVLKQLNVELHFDFCVTYLHTWTDTKSIVFSLKCTLLISTNC